MKLIDVGTEHSIVMLPNSTKDQVLFHRETPVAGKFCGHWYRSREIASLISQGHVNRYLGHLNKQEVNWVSQETMDEYVSAL
jgi:hypothetical protein